jgi:hypothetical protein
MKAADRPEFLFRSRINDCEITGTWALLHREPFRQLLCVGLTGKAVEVWRRTGQRRAPIWPDNGRWDDAVLGRDWRLWTERTVEASAAAQQTE